jgi:hypothetical protein
MPFGEAYRSSTKGGISPDVSRGALRGIAAAALSHEYFNTMHKENAK